MSVFKSYLRQLIRQLKALKKAEEEGNKDEVRRIIAEPVYKIDTRLSSSYLDHAVDHVKAGVRRHPLLHIHHGLLQGGCHSLVRFFSFLHCQKLLPRHYLLLLVCLERSFLIHITF